MTLDGCLLHLALTLDSPAIQGCAACNRNCNVSFNSLCLHVQALTDLLFFFYNDVTANVLCQQLEFRIIIDCLFMHICWPSPVALLFLWEQLLFYIHVLVANAALTSIISDSSEEWRCLFLKKKCKTNLPKYSRSINTITITSISHSLRTFVPIWNCKARYH